MERAYQALALQNMPCPGDCCKMLTSRELLVAGFLAPVNEKQWLT